jgi:hypothetical protein
MREKCWRFLEGRNGEIDRAVLTDVTVDVASNGGGALWNGR